jgi:uncharacterized protein involved in exopolysaccharide biosynthesis
VRAFARHALLLVLTVLTGCGSGQPIYRANIKLLISTTGPANSVGNHEDDDRFVAGQADILRGVTLLQRVERRLKRTAEEVRDNLTNLKVTPVRGTDIIVVSVDSPSADFARDFANALAEEYLKFREEQRLQTTDNALQQLTGDLSQLGRGLERADSNLAAYAQQHDSTSDAAFAEALGALREDRDRIQRLHDAFLDELVKIDAARSLNARNVIILEPAILERDRVR